MMNAIRTALVASGLVFVLLTGCDTGKEPKRRWDGGAPPLREECNLPSANCHDSCIKRDASITCAGCCRDQRLLCDTQQPYNFQYCDSAQ